MDFEGLKNDFLSRHTEGILYESSTLTYGRKMDVFYEFIKFKYGTNNLNYEMMLRSIDAKVILESIKYYVEKYNIKFKCTVDNYISVVTEYFRFLNKEHLIKNNMFDSQELKADLQLKIKQMIKQLKLDKSEQKSPITSDAFKKILNDCDSTICEYDVNSEIKENATNYQRFASSIMVKIFMLAGVKNHVISQLKYGDYIEELNMLKINGFNIHLPNNLGKQMSKYKQVRNNITENCSLDSPLFVFKDGSGIGTRYNFMCDMLLQTINNRKAESVSKYTVMQMIRKGINFNMILDLTSLGMSTCLHCQELVDEQKSKDDNTSRNRYIDYKIRSMTEFDML